MSTTNTAARTATITTPIVATKAMTVLVLASVTWIALLVVYFIGIDEGAMSVTGDSMMLHEFFHDGRHLLGFPCH